MLEQALGRGFDLVLANKVPLAGEQSWIDGIVVAAAVQGRRILSEATVGAGLPVILVGVSASDPLASLTGTDNQFAITTRRYQHPLVITGPGAGAPVTAAGVFNDLLKLVAERHSTGVRAGKCSRSLGGWTAAAKAAVSE